MHRKRSEFSRLRGLLCLWLLAWPGFAPAADDNYLILALLGDRLTIVYAERQIGTNIDRNRREVRPLTDSGLDDFAVATARATIAKVQPSARITMLRATDPGLYTLRNSWLDSDSVDVKALTTLVAKLFPGSAGARMLLIAPYRDALDLKSTSGYYGGESKEAGLGFYVDSRTAFKRNDTQEVSVGFLGVFANFQLLLITLDAGAVDAQERIRVGTTFAAARAPDKAPWNALSSQEKIKTLQALVKRELERTLPAMLAARH
jgi:hypothetical protein